MAENHLDDTQCWLVANVRRNPQVDCLRLRDGLQPNPPLTHEQVHAWDAHAKSCPYCEAMVQCHLFSIRHRAKRRSKFATAPPAREQSWDDTGE